MRTIKILTPIMVAAAARDVGELVEVDVDTAAVLVAHGLASIDDGEAGDAVVKALADHKVDELKAIAEAEGVALPEKANKAAIVEAIEKARAQASAGA
jgi:hypothetical protein